jgi:hypothetical protein
MSKYLGKVVRYGLCAQKISSRVSPKFVDPELFKANQMKELYYVSYIIVERNNYGWVSSFISPDLTLTPTYPNQYHEGLQSLLSAISTQFSLPTQLKHHKIPSGSYFSLIFFNRA